MNQNSTNAVSQEHGVDRLPASLWKRVVLAVLAAILVIGITGCTLDDLSSTFNGDVPFGQEQTTLPDMGAVDNTPTVADDAAFDDLDSRPLPPLS